jgi:predicted transcriptional regulator
MFIRIEGGQAMSKEAVFTMKLEPELRDAFMAEALASHRPASQVMRELMRDFVQHQREAREYGDFLRAKVELARGQVSEGHFAGGDEVEARFAARRAQLRAATGDAGGDGGRGAGSGAVP